MTYMHTTNPNGGGSQRKEIVPGWHNLTVSMAYDETREGEPLETRHGTPFIRLLCEDDAGARLKYDLFLTERASWKIDLLLAACDINFDEGQEVPITPALFEGRSFRGKVIAEESNGKTYTKIDRVAPTLAEPSEPPMNTGCNEDSDEDDELNEDVPF